MVKPRGILRNFGGKIFMFYLRGTKREIDSEAKRLKEFGNYIRRTKSKKGWNLWVRKGK